MPCALSFRLLSISLIFLGLFCNPVWAAPRQIEVAHTYLMGDNESKSQARANCLNEAKRKAAEEAGVYVEVLSRSENFQLASDEVQSFAAAVLRVQILKEEIKMVGESLAISLVIRAELDPDEVKRKLEALDAERRAAKLRKAQEPQNAPGVATNPTPVPTPTPTPEPMRLPPPADPAAVKAALAAEIEQASQRAAAYAEPGMTREDIEKVLGSPRAVKDGNSYLGYNYGRVWVVFRDDMVACVRTRLEYSQRYDSDVHCTGMAYNFIKR
jgi:hypothetical protein